jgi:calcium binding protein
MASAKRSPIRERRIANEIVVDAYTESERAMGWYYYLENRLHFPFRARCISERSISPLERGEQVSVVGMAPEDECMREVFVRIRWGRRSLDVPLLQLEPRQADPETRQGVGDWHYWVGQGYIF